MTCAPRSSQSTSPRSNKLGDPKSRLHKGQKIYAVLKEVYDQDISQAVLLDVGCSYGFITQYFSRHCHTCIGLEYDRLVLPISETNSPFFVQGDAEQLPITDESIDIVICAQVYEHTPDAERLAAEIYRVLRPGGLCFFSGPNRLFIYEYHYKLPFIHWFPDRIAAWLLSLFRPTCILDVHSRTYRGLRKLWSSFEIADFTHQLIKHPDRYSCSEELGKLSKLSSLPTTLIKWMIPLSPNLNWVLRKI